MTKKEILAKYRKVGGRIGTRANVRIKNKKDLALFYTPSVGTVSTYLSVHPEKARELSIKKNTVAVISDGSAVLGLGNIGPYGALPVMEGKALIFKEFADVDAVPIVLATQDPDEIVNTILAIAPAFGGINLEDIAAPKCFDIERKLIDALSVPVMHDDQHGTAIVVLAGLINAHKVTKRVFSKSTIVVNGTGAAGSAVMRLIKKYEPRVRIIALDTKGIIHTKRTDLSQEKQHLLTEGIIVGDTKGGLTEALTNADVFIGLSKGNLLTKEHVRVMKKQSIIFALANPTPEIMPDVALSAGASVVATGRSDFPNQINNALVFPGIFRGALDKQVTKITDETKLRAARALASLVKRPTKTNIIPDMFNKQVVTTVARAVK